MTTKLRKLTCLLFCRKKMYEKKMYEKKNYDDFFGNPFLILKKIPFIRDFSIEPAAVFIRILSYAA